MARTESTMLTLGTSAPDFMLYDTDDNLVALADFDDAEALLVMFLCNHCPYVKHIRHALAAFAREYEAKGLAMVAISSNDAEKYPADSPEHMREEKEQVGYPFPYLYDYMQEVAAAYQAACTPDFFLFDQERRLVYRGRFDSSSPGKPDPVTGEDLRRAVDALLAGAELPQTQYPSIGCNIKWKPGNEPEYYQGKFEGRLDS
ncbi:MAG TPA: thioredoxin family protein [Nitrococcus sp.]|nr:thioredoxin family protein [Nitrococcus sp.]